MSNQINTPLIVEPFDRQNLLRRARQSIVSCTPIILLLITTFPFCSYAESRRCAAPLATEDSLYSDDFRWGLNPDEIKEKYKEIYTSGKRLSGRAYFDPAVNSYILPVLVDGKLIPTAIPSGFFKSVTQHIEKALEKKYAEAIIFSDMGHAHFLIPETQWQSDYSQIPPSKLDLFYQRLLGSPTLKVLYHLAEQLKMVDDRKQLLDDLYLQRRYSTRNILGFNDGSSSLEILVQKNPEAFNTVNELDGHYFYGGFNISGSKDGCFSYIDRGTVHHYDLSLKDLEPTPGTYAD